MNSIHRTAIVTGAGSGIGEAVAKLFSSRDIRVAVADCDLAAGQRVVREICAQRGEGAAVFIHTDVSREPEIIDLVDRALGTCRHLDILVNNASIALAKPIDRLQEEEWDRIMDVNLKSMYLMIKHTISALRARRGVIVNMASLNGLVGQRMNAAYSASKGAVIAMTKSLALDYAADGVRVNCICPAGVNTMLLERWINQQEDPAATRKQLERMHPVGRIAEPDEIARAAYFLAGNDAGFITGVALPVDGGASLGY